MLVRKYLDRINQQINGEIPWLVQRKYFSVATLYHHPPTKLITDKWAKLLVFWLTSASNNQYHRGPSMAKIVHELGGQGRNMFEKKWEQSLPTALSDLWIGLTSTPETSNHSFWFILCGLYQEMASALQQHRCASWALDTWQLVAVSWNTISWLGSHKQWRFLLQIFFLISNLKSLKLTFLTETPTSADIWDHSSMESCLPKFKNVDFIVAQAVIQHHFMSHPLVQILYSFQRSLYFHQRNLRTMGPIHIHQHHCHQASQPSQPLLSPHPWPPWYARPSGRWQTHAGVHDGRPELGCHWRRVCRRSWSWAIPRVRPMRGCGWVLWAKGEGILEEEFSRWMRDSEGS